MYITADDVRATVRGSPSAAGDSGTAAELDDATIEKAIAAQQAIVEAYARTRWPDDQAPDLVKSLVRDLAAYDATLVYRRSKDLSQFDPIYLRYQEARQILTDIAAGRVQVEPDPDEPGTGEGGRATVINPYAGRLFDRSDVGLHPTPRGHYQTGWGDWW